MPITLSTITLALVRGHVEPYGQGPGLTAHPHCSSPTVSAFGHIMFMGPTWARCHLVYPLDRIDWSHAADRTRGWGQVPHPARHRSNGLNLNKFSNYNISNTIVWYIGNAVGYFLTGHGFNFGGVDQFT